MKYVTRTNKYPQPCRQTGAVLIIGLVLLVSLTVIGIGVLGSSSLEQRMAGNMTDQNLAFTTAETAGRAFTARIRNGNFEKEAICQGLGGVGCTVEDILSARWSHTADDQWWAANSFVLGANLIDQPIEGVYAQPSLSIVPLRHVSYTKVKGGTTGYGLDGLMYIAVTSRGKGASNDTEVIIQQVIAKR